MIEGRLAAAMVIVPFGCVLPKKIEGGADRSSMVAVDHWPPVF